MNDTAASKARSATQDHRFVATKEYRRFEEFCEACRRERYIGLCYGPPGVGKTISARYYAQWDQLEGRDPLDAGVVVPPEIAACRALLITPGTTNTPRSVREQVSHGQMLLRGLVGRAEHDPVAGEKPTFSDCCELILVDEADRLCGGPVT